MTEGRQDDNRQVIEGWLEGHTPASVPYIIAFSVFVPVILGINIALEFGLGSDGFWVAIVRQGLLNAGTMSTWGIPLTIISTEGITRMLAKHYIAKREKEAKTRFLRQQEDLAVWYKEQVAKWEERRRQAEADGRDFSEPPPEPPPGINTNGYSP